MTPSTRERLVSVAAKLLDAGGPAAVTLRAVGEAAGVSHNAPYKHFRDKQDLLAAIAARELARQSAGDGQAALLAPLDHLKRLVKGYVAWAMRYPERFKLTFGRWTIESAELTHAAGASRGRFVAAVAAAQKAGKLPKGDPERLGALLLALAHGAADMALSGHLARDGKGHADPDDLVDDLFLLLTRKEGR